MNGQRSLTGRALAAVAVLLSILSTWALARPLSEIDQNRRHFAELHRHVTAARESRAARATERGRVMRLRAQARVATGVQRDAFEAEAQAIEVRLGWSDRSAVRAVVLAEPLVRIARTTALPSDVVPTSSANGNGCIACHAAIATSGFENYPPPFRTHPALSTYVGAESPHAPSRVGCASCHRGDGRATTFSSAGHSRLRSADPVEPPARHSWAAVGASGAMLPVGRTEAACITCHAGELYQPGAPSLNEALVTLERGGCYACHDVPGMEHTARRGPDLRRVSAKLSPDWVKAWLANPRAVKPATWMPRFWTGAAPSEDDAAAIEAVTAYLFASSEPYMPAIANPAGGDPVRGKTLVDAVGCLGCHVVGDVSRDQSSVRRTFGQPLDGVGSKTTYAWLYDWIRDPSRYSPGTRMPNLRLSGQEAADVATYLTTVTRDVAPPLAVADGDDERYRSVVRRYANAASPDTASAVQATGESLKVAAGRAVIGALGCFNCHEIRGFEDKRSVFPMKGHAVWQEADVRAVHATRTASGARARSAPDLGIGQVEASRLALALTAVSGDAGSTHAISMPWHLVKVAGRTLVHQRNCVGCHAIEGVGGDLVTLVAEPTLGPPLLTPEGSRVQPEWLRGFLRQPKTIRPWLSVRMPTFGLPDEEVERAGDYFRAIAPENPKPGAAASRAAVAAGKELFDLLKCQQCHVLGAIPKDQPTSNLAPDLRMAHERLQPEWILAWLRNPSAILPGTRMPTFWPDFPKSFYPPLDRDGAAQVRAIRDHLVTLR